MLSRQKFSVHWAPSSGANSHNIEIPKHIFAPDRQSATLSLLSSKLHGQHQPCDAPATKDSLEWHIPLHRKPDTLSHATILTVKSPSSSLRKPIPNSYLGCGSKVPEKVTLEPYAWFTTSSPLSCQASRTASYPFHPLFQIVQPMFIQSDVASEYQLKQHP